MPTVKLKTLYPYFTSSGVVDGEKWFTGMCKSFCWLINQTDTILLDEIFIFKKQYRETGTGNLTIDLSILFDSIWKDLKRIKYTKMKMAVVKRKYFQYNGCKDFLDFTLYFNIHSLSKTTIPKIIIEANFYASLICAIVGLGFGELKIEFTVEDGTNLENFVTTWINSIEDDTCFFRALFKDETNISNVNTSAELVEIFKTGVLSKRVKVIKFPTFSEVLLDVAAFEGVVDHKEIKKCKGSDEPAWKNLPLNSLKSLVSSDILEYDLLCVLPTITICQ